MKRMITCMMLVLAGMASVQAKSLWTGSQVYSDYKPVPEDARVMLQAADFADAAVGDKITLEFTYYATDPQSWHQIELWQSDMQASLTAGVHITATDTQASFTIDATMLAALQADGCALAGTGYTLTAVNLEAATGVLWEGTAQCVNWAITPAVRLLGTSFAAAKTGQYLVFEVKMKDTSKWSAIEVDNANYKKVDDLPTTELKATTTTVKFLITDNLLAELQANGINLTGDNYTLTKIYLENASADAAKVIWDEGKDVGNWGYFTIPASKFAKVVEGSVLVFNVGNLTAADAQICLKQNLTTGWQELPAETQWGNYIALENGTTQVTFNVTAAAAETMKANGLVVTGHDYTAVSVELDGVTSGIRRAENAAVAASGKVYTLQGTLVPNGQTLNRGIYIIGGRKVVVKE